MFPYSWLTEQAKIGSLCERYIRLLIIVDKKSQTQGIITILSQAKIIYNYDIISTAEKNLLSKLNQYDLVICDYYIQENNPLNIEKNLQYLFNLTRYIPIILITDQLGDEMAISCLKSGITGYILRQNLTLLPELIFQSIWEFSQKQKLQLQIILNSLMEKYKADFSLPEILELSLKIIEENLINTHAFIYLSNETKKIDTTLPYFLQEKKILPNLISITGFYEHILEKGHRIFINKSDENLPDTITNIFHNEQVDNLFLVPLISKNNYLGLIVIEREYNSHQWLSIDLNLIDLLAQELSFIISEIFLRNSLQNTIDHLEKETEIIKNKQDAKLELFSHLTHELRTPLTGILGFSKMLNEQIYGELNPKQLQYVQGIKQSGEHLLELINDILDLSKIDAVKEELLIEKIAVEDICLASMSMVKELANQKNLELKLEINPEIGLCNCDQRRFKQILLNLLSNAIKFTDTGYITLKVSSKKDYILFSVIDTGIGIKKEDQAKLFQPFIQLKTPIHKKYKGTGLGLALSRKLAQLHGGDITLISEEGKGSCFTIFLPQ